MWFIYLSVLQGSDLCLGAILGLVSETKIKEKKNEKRKKPPQNQKSTTIDYFCM